MKGEILRFEGIGKSYFGVPVLQGISLSLRKGCVLGLVGENGAGKSTLMNILGGVTQPDTGEMSLAGSDYTPRSPEDAARRRIGFIHQELNLFSNLSVAENLMVPRFPRKKILGLSFTDRGRLRRQARDLLHKVKLDVNPDTPVSELSPGERQLVEIAKVIQQDAEIIILDEPTSSLTVVESERLFLLIEEFRQRQVSMIYISHVLEDVLRLSDEIVVLRDGEMVGQGLREEFDQERLVKLMVGRTIQQLFPVRKARHANQVLLDVRGLSQPGVVNNVTFTLARGEVLGIYGLMGSGRTELARLIFGLEGASKGEIRIADRLFRKPRPRNAISQGMAFLTESRREEGLLMEASIHDNIALVSLPGFQAGFGGFLDQERLSASIKAQADTLRIRGTALEHQKARSLSGGNQQKVVIAKWLLNQPRVFILDEPTRGIDIGAKQDVYNLVCKMADRGMGILFVSSELEELIGMCDRILIMAQGEIRGSIPRDRFDREMILRLALGEKAEVG
jgi:ribose transport system ATP-binding protein